MLTAVRQLYMLAHHPAAYFAALLAETERGKKAGRDDERIVGHIRAAMSRGIKVLPPDVRRSAAEFDLREGQVLYGLGKVKGVAGAAEAIVAARPFASLEELLKRVDRRRAHARVMQALILAGAMDDLPCQPPPGWEDEEGAEPIERRNMLVAAVAAASPSKKKTEVQKAFTPTVLRQKEGELLGLTLSWWASNAPDELRQAEGLSTVASLDEEVVRFGVLVEVVRVKSFDGKRGAMAFLAVSDETGTLENVTLWSEHWKLWKEKLSRGKVVALRLVRRENERKRYGRWSYYLDDRHRDSPVQTLQVLARKRSVGEARP